ncbi:NAD(P)/FAD-dependent oxidoreductase [Parvularcula marina]|uniref:Pyridine nucleotide-disulfide oxidoreductase n=1 Tax=Parvularcula marina TaxID=2292771 RepID=A0A371RLE3_9PROT|nr:FAD-dependent oxidoreductase [Parvularcula marina]RFB06263.1 pyridine nucleotide-disulfide oxidoreductase [Parvularcula marina]
MQQSHFDILIIGGGQAGRRAAEGAREASPSATIAILGEEIHLPYDRPSLSKERLLDPDDDRCFVRQRMDFDEKRIELFPGQCAVSIDRQAHLVRTEEGREYGYGRLILATGSRVRWLPSFGVPGERVMALRTLEDCANLSGRIRQGARIVVIGAGFIGLEVAAAARQQGASVKVIEAGSSVLGRVFPPAAADHVARLQQEMGVEILLDTSVRQVTEGPDGVAVEIGVETLRADIAVVGIGVIPNLELAIKAGLDVVDGIMVDKEGRSSDPDIYAAGEVTAHPVLGCDRSRRLESWQVAEEQAYAAGRSAAGSPTAYAAWPWFWSDQGRHNIQMLGLADSCANWIAREYDHDRCSFVALDDAHTVTGMITINAGGDIGAGRRLLGTTQDPAQLRDPEASLRSLIPRRAAAQGSA